MPGVYLPMGPNPDAFNANWASTTNTNTDYKQHVVATANLSGGVRRTQGLRWILPAGITKDNIRSAALILAGFDDADSRNDPYFTLAGEKVRSAGPYTTASTPNSRYVANATTAKFDVRYDNILGQPKIFTIIGGATFTTVSLLDVIKEIMNVPNWETGNRAISLFLRGASDVNKDQWFQNPASSGIDSFGPRLQITYGDVSEHAVDFDLCFIGNSHPAYAGHAGFPVFGMTLPGVFPGITMDGCVGMQGAGNVYGFDGADAHRGWTQNGYVQQSMEGRWGTEVEIFRGEFAVAGSTCAQWYSDIGNVTTGRWGDPNGSYSARYRMKHPLSPSERQVWIAEFLGNDVHNWGQDYLLHSMHDSYWEHFLEVYDPYLRGCLDEMYNRAKDPSKMWVYSPGLPNFPILNAASSIPYVQYFPTANSGIFFESVYTIQGTGGAGGACGYRQAWYDIGLDGAVGHYDSGALADQSAYIQAAARYQQLNYPSEIPPGMEWNPAAPNWGFGLYTPNINFPAAGPMAHTTWGYGGIDFWQVGLRNITDINVNRRFHQCLDTLWEGVAADYPHVIYVPSWRMLGTDTAYSSDPTSEYAQSVTSKWVEGIHPNLVGLNDQWNGPGCQLDRMEEEVPFLQRFHSYFSYWDGTDEIPIYLDGVWTGTEIQFLWVDGLTP